MQAAGHTPCQWVFHKLLSPIWVSAHRVPVYQICCVSVSDILLPSKCLHNPTDHWILLPPPCQWISCFWLSTWQSRLRLPAQWTSWHLDVHLPFPQSKVLHPQVGWGVTGCLAGACLQVAMMHVARCPVPFGVSRIASRCRCTACAYELNEQTALHVISLQTS